MQITGTDSFGAYFDVGIKAGATNVGIIVHNGNTKDPGPDELVNPSTQGNEFWQVSGVVGLSTTRPPTTSQKNPNIPANTARVHFFRPDSNYANWTVYAFNDTTADTGNYNGGPIQSDRYRRLRRLLRCSALQPNPQDLGFIVHNIQTGTKNTPSRPPPQRRHLQRGLDHLRRPHRLPYPANRRRSSSTPTSSSCRRSGSIATPSPSSRPTSRPNGKYFLSSDLTADLQLTHYRRHRRHRHPSHRWAVPSPPPSSPASRSSPPDTPLSTSPPISRPPDYRTLLEGQLAVSILRPDGTLAYATGVQDAGVLDDLYAYSGKLGVIVPPQR